VRSQQLFSGGSFGQKHLRIFHLTDAEILEREKRLAVERAKETPEERNRMSKARNFHFRGGML
jgi:hypothetical protein